MYNSFQKLVIHPAHFCGAGNLGYHNRNTRTNGSFTGLNFLRYLLVCYLLRNNLPLFIVAVVPEKDFQIHENCLLKIIYPYHEKCGAKSTEARMYFGPEIKWQSGR